MSAGLWRKLRWSLRGSRGPTIAKIESSRIPTLDANKLPSVVKHQVRESEDGILRAAWQSSLLDAEEGYSCYTSNSLESLWSLMDKIESSPENLRETLEVRLAVEKYVKKCA